MKTISGFYKTRIMSILMKTNTGMSTHQIWACFKKAYRDDLRTMAGKTKMASVQSAVSRLANDRHIVKMFVDSGKTRLALYTINAKTTKHVTTQEVECEKTALKTKGLHELYDIMIKDTPSIASTLHKSAAHTLCDMKFSLGYHTRKTTAISWAT